MDAALGSEAASLRSIVWALLVVAAESGCGGRDKGAGAGAWEFKVDTLESGSGGTRQTAWLRVVGQEGPEGKPRDTPVILSFDCLPDDAPSTIMTEQALRQGSAETRLTVDGKPPLELAAFAGTTPSGGQVVLRVPQDSVLGALAGGRRALIEYADGAGSSQTTAEFPIGGLETYRERFLSACRRAREPLRSDGR